MNKRVIAMGLIVSMIFGGFSDFRVEAAECERGETITVLQEMETEAIRDIQERSSEETMDGPEDNLKQLVTPVNGIASGKCGENLTWELTDESLTIRGTGEMWNYDDTVHDVDGEPELITLAPWGEYLKDKDFKRTLRMEEGITVIGKYAFEGCVGLSGTLELPESLVEIRNGGFYHCSGFTGELRISKGVEKIGEQAFRRCSGFTGDLVIPDTVKSIDRDAFSSCSGLKGDLIIGDGIEIIKPETFASSGFTGNLVLGKNVKEIGYLSFIGDGFTGNLQIPEGVRKIGEGAFYGCVNFNGNLAIPDSVTMIDDCAFYECYGFDGILTLGSNLETIGEAVFIRCYQLKGNLCLPESLTEIGSNAFDGCSSLTGDLKIPSGITKISKATFYNCVGLTGNLSLPDTLTEIEDFAFRGCGFSGELKLPSSVKKIDTCAFYMCKGLKGELVLPEQLTEIGDSAFAGCSGFEGNLMLSGQLTEIGRSAFNACTGFQGKLTIGESVTQIRNFAFQGTSFSSIQFMGDAPQIEQRSFGNVIAKVYYPPNAKGWDNAAKKDYGGCLSWIAYRKGETPDAEGIPLSSSDGLAWITDLPAGGYEYTGKAHRPVVAVADSEGNILKKNKDYTVSYKNNVNAGMSTITIKGKGKKKAEVGTKTILFPIRAVKLEGMYEILPVKMQTYTMTERKPTVKVRLLDGKKILKGRRDYNVSYNENVNSGTATVTVTGFRNYEGTLTQTFVIQPRSLKKGIKVGAVKSQLYSGNEIKPEPVVKYGKKVLLKGIDYTVSYRNNTEKGKATIEITGIGNYSGTISKNFRIK